MTALLSRLLPASPPPSADPGALLAVDHLDLAYGQSRAVRNVSLRVAPGQVVCVVGRNGAGKTTLLKGIIGSLGPRAGRILFEGRDLTGSPPYQRARAGIGYVPQGRGIFPHLSVYENLLIGLEPVRGRLDGQLEQVFTLFPVLKEMARRTAGVLSGGQQQQLAIGRALMGRPRLLLLDEPTEGIQPSIVQQIEEVIAGLKGSLAVLLVEQFLDFALAIGDYCYVLESGQVTFEGTPGSLDTAALRSALAV
ncbi:urea ABC transporter ATP-binding subunit UrtE [Tepidiforma sp.]|uniref:urea ABC transporter ATP-binding subunit UrtE n=1 Tax=Tepidiforma sp. TaxID=2682230 RepID=UPI002ADD33DC|nr:urea ABC transporter ATP-binding subunit UrtE [Tepidiforma sp.]